LRRLPTLILGRGYGLHWEALDADLSVPGLLAGLFGAACRQSDVSSQGRGGARKWSQGWPSAQGSQSLTGYQKGDDRGRGHVGPGALRPAG